MGHERQQSRIAVSEQLYVVGPVDPVLAEKIAAAGWALSESPELTKVRVIDCRQYRGKTAFSDGFAGATVAIIDTAAEAKAAKNALSMGASHVFDVQGHPSLLEATLESAAIHAAAIERKQHGSFERLELLFHDSAARRWIDESLQQGQPVAVILFALRNLGTVNAAYGRSAGDDLLRRSCAQLLDFLGTSGLEKGMVARLDGQHMLLAFHKDAAQADAKTAAENALRQLNDQPGNRDIPLAFCAGIASSNRRDNSATLLRRADMVLLEALADQGTIIADSDSVPDRLAVVGQLETDLQRAMDGDQFAIVLQPQFRCATGALTGAEALVRWHHPEFGEIGGATVFTVAERAGLIRQVSDVVQAKALAAASAWPESLSFLRLSINVTASDLAAPGFVDQFLDMVAASGFAPGRLTIELIESHQFGNISEAAERLAEIRANGIRIAIDDFGTGYSSLSYLKDLPIDYLKVDSSFTSQLDGSAEDRIIVDSIIRLAHSLSLDVIAEGVETESQLEELRTHGAHYFQGFLRAGPLDQLAFEAFALRSN